ncbi:MAG: hypothetical protein ABUT20_61800, partial [Bacteroidota bacterium]
SAGMDADAVGSKIKMRDLKFTRTENDVSYFKQGTYIHTTGLVQYTTMELPFVLNKLTQLHKASTKDPLYYFNIFFAASLLFFVVSAFWMFTPKTQIFKKGLYFTLAGFILMLVMLYI